MKKIYVVGEAIEYANFIVNSKLTSNIEDANIILFTGGEDVDPSLYGKEKHPLTYSNIKRDLYEKEIFNKIRKDQLVIGICRGSQFLCVMNGGLLVQDVENHAIWETHPIYNVKEYTLYDITSTHHQMQYPYNLDKSNYEVLYKTYDYLSRYYEGDGIDSELIYQNGEPEIVLYKNPDKPRCLAIQGHPEYMRKDAPVVKMLNSLINKYLKF